MRTQEEVNDFSIKLLNCETTKSSIEFAKNKILIDAFEACIPKDFQNIDRKDIRHNVNVFKNTVEKYIIQLNRALNNGYGILFVGDNGVGKTFFISYILMEVIRKNKTAYYTTAPQLEHNLKKGWRLPEIEKRLEWMLTSDFVAIDELGKETEENKNDPFMINQIERIMKQRCDDNLPMLIASNKSFGDLKSTYGTTFGSIITGKFQVVIMESGDYRKELAKKMQKEMGYGV